MGHLMKIALMAVLTASIACSLQGQDVQSPLVRVQGNRIEFVGKFAKISGDLPQKDVTWLYHVENPRARLFVYSFWTIAEFQDRKEPNSGFYRAKSWTVQVLDSSEEPETRVIFDRTNDFFFRGKIKNMEQQMEVRIATIEGLPGNSYGPVLLKKLK